MCDMTLMGHRSKASYILLPLVFVDFFANCQSSIPLQGVSRPTLHQPTNLRLTARRWLSGDQIAIVAP